MNWQETGLDAPPTQRAAVLDGVNGPPQEELFSGIFVRADGRAMSLAE